MGFLKKERKKKILGILKINQKKKKKKKEKTTYIRMWRNRELLDCRLLSLT
jgi:hypothetical protein